MTTNDPHPDDPTHDPVTPDELRLSAELDGELSAQDRRELDRAIADDPALTRTRDELRRTEAALDEWTVPGPSPEFAARVVDALPTTGRTLRLRWLPWATAAAVLVGAGVFVAQSRLGGSSVADPVEATGSLSDAELEAIAEDLDVLANLDALTLADEQELIRLTDDLDLLDELGPTDPIALEDLPDNG